MNGLVYIRDVVTLELDTAHCDGCGMCIMVCPHEVFALREKRAVITDRDACMECGACAVNCPTGAISVQAGVGCAAAVINSALGRTESECGCVAESREVGGAPPPESTSCCGGGPTPCC
jgi:ferredoxin